MLFAKPTMALAVCWIVLSGCAVTPENAFPEARTVGECQGQFQAAQRTTRHSMSNARSQTRGGGLLGAFVLGIAGGASESNDKTKLLACLQRVGATPEQMRVAVNGQLTTEATPVTAVSGGLAPTRQAPVQAVQPRSASCPPKASVLYGGTQYCTGR